MSYKFSKQADLYARYRPTYPDELYTLIHHKVQSTEEAWDCATGSGQVARVLADHFEHVDATDISEEQLKHAVERPNIDYHLSPAEHTSFPDRRFDLITVAQAIHWFDIDAFYSEARRVGKKGGLLAVIGYGMLRINPQVNPVLDELYEQAFGNYFAENRRLIDRHYQPLPFPFEELHTPEFEVKLSWTLNHLEGFFNSWSAIERMRSETGTDPVPAVMKQLRQRLEGQNGFDVTFPVFMRLGRIT